VSTGAAVIAHKRSVIERVIDVERRGIAVYEVEDDS